VFRAFVVRIRLQFDEAVPHQRAKSVRQRRDADGKPLGQCLERWAIIAAKAVLPQPCTYRGVMLKALEAAGRASSTIACTASSLMGIQAAVAGGLGVTCSGDPSCRMASRCSRRAGTGRRCR
jgi:DNA-binding transcriptional LysR family regulator